MAKEQMTGAPALQLKRTFSAPREKVFRAWTDPKELARWFAPTPDHSATVPELDLRVGGQYRIEIRHKGGNVHKVSGTYREIAPPEKVAFTWSWENDPAKSVSLVTVELRDLGASTELLLTHEQLPSVEDRGKHEQGWTGCFDQLAKYL